VLETEFTLIKVYFSVVVAIDISMLFIFIVSYYPPISKNTPRPSESYNVQEVILILVIVKLEALTIPYKLNNLAFFSSTLFESLIEVISNLLSITEVLEISASTKFLSNVDFYMSQVVNETDVIFLEAKLINENPVQSILFNVNF